MARVWRSLPDELHRGTGDLRRDPQNVRRPSAARESSWLLACGDRGVTKAFRRGRRRRAPSHGGRSRQRTLASARRTRAHQPSRLHLEHDPRRCCVPHSKKASAGRAGGKGEPRQDDRSQQSTPNRSNRRSDGELWRLCRSYAPRRLVDRDRHVLPGSPARLGKQLPRVLGEHRVDQHQLRADRPDSPGVGLTRFEQQLELGRRRLDVDWARVHRDSLTGIPGRGGGAAIVARGRFSRS